MGQKNVKENKTNSLPHYNIKKSDKIIVYLK